MSLRFGATHISIFLTILIIMLGFVAKLQDSVTLAACLAFSQVCSDFITANRLRPDLFLGPLETHLEPCMRYAMRDVKTFIYGT